MANSTHKPSREERLGAKLRENLRRRKAQARALGEDIQDAGDESTPVALPKDGAKS